MSTYEKKKMILGAIRKLEDMLCSLRYSYDGIKSREERDADIEVLQGHLHATHGALVLVNELEIKEAA